MMGGDVTVTSELGKGSLFTVRLPGVIMPCASKHSTSGYALWAHHSSLAGSGGEDGNFRPV
jgi:hypothetical protein